MTRQHLRCIIVFILIIYLLTSCERAVPTDVNTIDIGVIGQLSIETADIPFTLDQNIGVQTSPNINFQLEITDRSLRLNITEPLEIGEEYSITVSKEEIESTFKAVVRPPCLIYLGNVTSEPEVWKFCVHENNPLTATGGKVVDFGSARYGNWIIYSVLNERGGTDIWKMDRYGENEEMVHSCGELFCTNLAVDSVGDLIAFFTQGSKGELFLFSIHDHRKIVVERGNISNIDFSPDGNSLRYFVNKAGKLRVFDIENLNLAETIESDSNLIGSWKEDSSGFLLGKQNFWGGMAGIDVFEFTLSEGSLSKLFDGQAVSENYFQPTYISDENLAVLVRTGFSGNSNQIWITKKDGAKIKNLTNDHQYDHSALSWNPYEGKLVFQRYLLTRSDSLPEVWVWEKENNILSRIAQNAAHAIWLP